MKRYTRPCLFATIVFGIMSCTEPAPTDFDAASDSSPDVLAKKGGKPGGGGPGDFTNWAFAATKGGSAIQLLSFDGSITSTLVGGGKTGRYSPRFSDDGSEVAYLRGNELRIVSIDGSGDRKVFEFGSTPGPWYVRFDWIPGSRKIIYQGYSDLFVVDADVGEPEALAWPSLFAAEGWLGEVSAGPDLGTSPGFQGPIVVSWGTYDPGGNESDLYVVMLRENLDGPGPPSIALDGSLMARLELPDYLPDDGGQNHPVFSPDGSRIAFVDKVFCCHGQELKVIDFDLDTWTFTSDPRLVASVDITPSLYSISYQPTWAPDGSWIAFHGNYFGNGPNLNGGLSLVQPDDNVTTVLSSKVASFHPDWNPVWVAD